jgi:hypothetical protein
LIERSRFCEGKVFEIAFLTLILLACWYVFLGVKAALYWMWERVLAVRAFSYSLSLECRRRRDGKSAELRANRHAYDNYRQTRLATQQQEHRQAETGVTLRRAFRNLSGIHGLVSLTTDVTSTSDLPISEKRSLFNECVPKLVDEVEAQLRGGVPPATLRAIVTTLVTACGHPDAQAELILSSATARVHSIRDTRLDFASELREELSLHRERLQAIEHLRDDPTYEQMLEVEHGRHSQALIQLSATDRTPSPHVVTL